MMFTRILLTVCLLSLLPATAVQAQDSNLALNKKATQSSTDARYNADASRAVDGNTSGHWGNDSVTHTRQQGNPWWEVDLGQSFRINRIEVWNRTDCCVTRLNNFSVLVRQRRNTRSIQFGNRLNTVTGSTPNQIVLTDNRVGRYVRVQLRGTNILSLAEVRVYGTPSPAAPNQAGLVNILVRYKDVDGKPKVESVPASVIGGNGQRCDYRLEFDNPLNRPDWAIHEIASDLGPLQRYSRNNCVTPDFTAESENSAHYQQQTTYYWTMKMRDYAINYLWQTPPSWNGPPIKFSNRRVDPYVLTRGGTNHGCTPIKPPGCFRAWPHEGPRIYIRDGSANAGLIGHEYGHYATGYVYGHMDTLGFRFNECQKRSFQEAIAYMFADVFLHYARYEYQKDTVSASIDSQWTGQCGSNDYIMGNPLRHAFRQALYGKYEPDSGSAITVPWSDHNSANRFMVQALSYALAKNRGHVTADVAKHVVEYVNRHMSNEEISIPINSIFVAHGFKNLGGRCGANIECIGPRTTRCDNTRSPQRCIPDDGVGKVGEYCTHNKHCANLNCVGVASTSGGSCQTPGQIGDRCESNAGCSASRTTRCDNTRSPQRCIPDNGRGRTGDYCTHNNHCANGNCSNVTSTRGGSCAASRDIGDSCARNNQCNGSRTSRCDNTVSPRRCIPNDGWGRENEYCTHNNHCDARRNLVCRLTTSGGSGICRR